MKRKSFTYHRVTLITESNATATGTQSLLEIIKAMLTGASGSFTTFLQYLNNSFSISNMQSMSNSILDWSKDAANGGVVSKLFAGLGNAIGKAIGFATSLISSILKQTPQLNNLAFNSQFSYGTLLGMTVVASCALYVFSKIYKVLKRRFYESTSNKDIIKYVKVGVQKAIVESEITFSKLNRVTESVQLTEADIMMTLNNIVGKAWEICNDMLDWLSSIVSTTVSSTADFVNKHPKFVTAVLVCIGMVVMYNRCPQIKGVVDTVRKTANDAVNATVKGATTAFKQKS